MGPIILFRPIVSLCLALLLLSPAAALASDPWTPPTAEELAMTSIPEQPGAPAVVLWREVKKDAMWDATTVYVRIKVLTDAGKDWANVELPYSDQYLYDRVAGRTIHPDGSIVSFSGKPYEKVVEKQRGSRTSMLIFSLPAVEVGSILEYRYIRNHDYGPPEWFVQGDLYLRSAHFSWMPDPNPQIAWTPILPAGAKVIEVQMPRREITLDIKNVPPLPHEEMMPPRESIGYRVLLYYSEFKTAQAYWAAVGDSWSKTCDKFIGPGPGVRAAAAGIVAPGDSEETKARKIYTYVTHLENTDFALQLSERQAKAQGIKEFLSTDNIVSRHKGSSTQLTVLFVALARAAGIKAYLMQVSNRSRRLFLASDLDFKQLDDYIAVLEIDNVDVWFDPGTPFCPFGHLAWYHTLSGGLRQTAGGTRLATTPTTIFSHNHISRTADLSLDEHGVVIGKVRVIYTGDPARHWRELALLGDETSLETDLRSDMEEHLPARMEVQVVTVGELKDAEQPFEVTYTVHGSLGTSTGKRLLVPANLFEVKEKPLFPAKQRQNDIDMQYAVFMQDAVRYHVTPALAVETTPEPDTGRLKGKISFDTSSKYESHTITLLRNLSVVHMIFAPPDYKDLREFYQKLEAHNQDVLVLTSSGQTAECSSPRKPVSKNQELIPASGGGGSESNSNSIDNKLAETACN